MIDGIDGWAPPGLRDEVCGGCGGLGGPEEHRECREEPEPCDGCGRTLRELARDVCRGCALTAPLDAGEVF